MPHQILAHPAIEQATLVQALEQANLQLAWERVHANDGAAGWDGEGIARFGHSLDAELATLAAEVREQRYQPRPLLSVAVEKADGGTRELAIPSVRDRVLQTAVVRVLQPSIDPFLCDASFAYRPARSVPLALAEVEYWRDMGLRWVFESDIQSFFDRIPHGPLLQVVQRWVSDEGLNALISGWVRAIVWRQPPELLQRGVPQGSPLSPLLANLYLHKFDLDLRNAGHQHVRYADDFLVLTRTRDEALQAWGDAQSMLKSLGLALKESKTHVLNFDDGFEFLGARLVCNRIVAIDPLAQSHIAPKDKHRATVRGWKLEARAQPQQPKHDGRDGDTRCDGFDKTVAQGDVDGIDGDQPEFDEQSPIVRTLYVTTTGAGVYLRSDRIVVQKEEDGEQKRVASVPAAKVDQIVVYGNSMVSTALLRECATQGVAVHLLDHRGAHGASVEPDPRRNSALWQAQVAALDDKEANIALVGAFVKGKLHNQRAILQRWARRQTLPELTEAIAVLGQTLEATDRRMEIDTLRGHEGNAARVYFVAMAAVLGTRWPFAKRTRQPARDPVSAMLNFGYSLLHRLLVLHLVRRQLSPHLGHLHLQKPGHPALASDLMEEFRAPLVDALVADLARNGSWQATDFLTDENGAVWLPLELRRQYIAGWEAALARPIMHPHAKRAMDWQRIVEYQVQHYARVLLSQEPVYRPMLVR